jgi:hypothetical protein
MSQPDFSKMTPAEFTAWQEAEFSTRPQQGPLLVPGLPSPTPAPVQEDVVVPRPAAEVWGSTEYDFTCPSGAMCRLRKLMPEKLLELGILDKITTLPGVVAEVVEKAEGLPPRKADAIPDAQELRNITGILEVLVPLVVVEPKVFPVPVAGEDGVVPDRVQGRIYTDSIELLDRVAIMERSVQGVKKLEPFREGSGQPV